MMQIAVLWVTSLFTSLLGTHALLSRNTFCETRRPIPRFSANYRCSVGTAAKWQKGSNTDIESSTGRQGDSLDDTVALRRFNKQLDNLVRNGAPEQAQELFEITQDLYDIGKSPFAPDAVSFNTVLKAWQGDIQGAMAFWESAAMPGRLSIVSYNTMLTSYSKLGMHEAAEALLLEMQQIGSPVEANVISWSATLQAYATAMYRDNEPQKKLLVDRAEKLVFRMIHGGDRNDDGSLSSSHNIDPNYVPPKPNVITFNTLIQICIWHPSPSIGATRAEYWLHAMQNEFGIDPDVITYTSVMKALSKCRDDTIVHRVLSLLKDMKSGGVEPSRFLFTEAIEALSYNREMGLAYRVFEAMMQSYETRPTSSSYIALLNGWSKDIETTDVDSARNETTEAVKKFLSHVEILSRKWRDCALEPRHYTTILSIYASSSHYNSVDWALELLKDMRNAGVRPGTQHYNTALLCYAKSPRPNKAVEAEMLWNEMVKNRVPCTTPTYNIIMQTASKASGSDELRQQSLKIGLKAFNLLHGRTKDCSPSSFSYANYFKMVRRLVPPTSPDRLLQLKSGFTLCCENGCLDAVLLQDIVNKSTEGEARHLFEENFDNRMSLRTLPNAWSRNAKQGARRNR